MLEKLPSEGEGWSKAERDQWVKALELVLDLVYTIEKEEQKLLSAPQNGTLA
jgi:hypothetical protein